MQCRSVVRTIFLQSWYCFTWKSVLGNCTILLCVGGRGKNSIREIDVTLRGHTECFSKRRPHQYAAIYSVRQLRELSKMARDLEMTSWTKSHYSNGPGVLDCIGAPSSTPQCVVSRESRFGGEFWDASAPSRIFETVRLSDCWFRIRLTAAYLLTT